MEIKKIVDYINRGYIASDYLREPDVYYFMDMVIDDINERLQSKFPTFSEWGEFVAAWNAHVAGPNPVPGEGMPEKPEDKPEDKPKVMFPEHNAYPVMNEHRLPIERVPGQHRPIPLRANHIYDAFPDEYIRTVVALGVATKFYTRDEEGEQVALDYQNRYEAALFKMVRDYHNRVPWYFQDNEGGFIDFSYNREMYPFDLDPRGVVLRGDDTRII